MFSGGFQEKGRMMDNYKCPMCGYVYNPEKGFPVDDVKPGTPFEEIPRTWTCPVCGAKKEDFRGIQ